MRETPAPCRIGPCARGRVKQVLSGKAVRIAQAAPALHASRAQPRVTRGGPAPAGARMRPPSCRATLKINPNLMFPPPPSGRIFEPRGFVRARNAARLPPTEPSGGARPQGRKPGRGLPRRTCRLRQPGIHVARPCAAATRQPARPARRRRERSLPHARHASHAPAAPRLGARLHRRPVGPCRGGDGPSARHRGKRRLRAARRRARLRARRRAVGRAGGHVHGRLQGGGPHHLCGGHRARVERPLADQGERHRRRAQGVRRRAAGVRGDPGGHRLADRRARRGGRRSGVGNGTLGRVGLHLRGNRDGRRERVRDRLPRGQRRVHGGARHHDPLRAVAVPLEAHRNLPAPVHRLCVASDVLARHDQRPALGGAPVRPFRLRAGVRALLRRLHPVRHLRPLVRLPHSPGSAVLLPMAGVAAGSAGVRRRGVPHKLRPRHGGNAAGLPRLRRFRPRCQLLPRHPGRPHPPSGLRRDYGPQGHGLPRGLRPRGRQRGVFSRCASHAS